jgi:ComF family protein
MMRILFPKMCPICGNAVTPAEILCPSCAAGYTPEPLCMPIGGSARQAVNCRALYHYRGTVRRALLAMKFAGQPARAEGFGQMLGEMVRGEQYDVITFVPMDKRRQRLRGYNQAELLAKHCGKVCGIPVRPLLYKTRHTGIQHDLHGAAARAANMKDAFGAVPLNGARVLVCDDIVTTGTTLRSCVQVLERAGASEIQCICAAWTKEGL